jgi:hypothetical protein
MNFIYCYSTLNKVLDLLNYHLRRFSTGLRLSKGRVEKLAWLSFSKVFLLFYFRIGPFLIYIFLF